MDATPEEWRPVVGWEGCYEVSDLGNVRSVDRYRTHVCRDGKHTLSLRRGKPLKQNVAKRGYRVVALYNPPVRGKGRQVHRLVLEAFVGPCPPGMEACHCNGISDDNRLVNLRWDTRSNNNLDTVLHGTHRNARKTHCVQGHEFTADNTIVTKTGSCRRRCRVCEQQRDRDRYRRKVDSAERRKSA